MAPDPGFLSVFGEKDAPAPAANVFNPTPPGRIREKTCPGPPPASLLARSAGSASQPALRPPRPVNKANIVPRPKVGRKTLPGAGASGSKTPGTVLSKETIKYDMNSNRVPVYRGKEVIRRVPGGKVPRRNPGELVAEDIRFTQAHPGFIIPKAHFRKLVKSIVQNTDYLYSEASGLKANRFTEGAIDALQWDCEEFMFTHLGCGNIVAEAAGRQTTKLSDIRAGMRIGQAYARFAGALVKFNTADVSSQVQKERRGLAAIEQ